MIVADNKAMNGTVVSNRLGFDENITISGDSATIDSETKKGLIWTLGKASSNWTFQNLGNTKYAASTGKKNQADLLTDANKKSQWTIKYSNGFVITNIQNTENKVNATLRKNGTYGFACYGASTGSAPELYKEAAALSSLSGKVKEGQTFAIGDRVTNDDFVVTANYSDGTSKSVSDFIIEDPLLSSESNDVVISFTEDGVTKQTTVTVSASASSKTLVSEELVWADGGKSYFDGDDWDFESRLSFKLNFDDGSTQTVPYSSDDFEITVKNVDGSTLAKPTLGLTDAKFEVYYNNSVFEFEKTFDVSGLSVSPIEVESLIWTGHKDVFVTGTKFVLTGELKAKLNNKSEAELIDLSTEGVVVKLGGSVIDPNTYLFEKADSGKTLEISYTAYGSTHSVSTTITVSDLYTVDVLIKDYASSNSWKDNSPYYTVILDDFSEVKATASKGTNNGKYISNNESWRFYAADKGTLTLSGLSGVTIKSCTLTFELGDKAASFVDSKGEAVTSGVAIDLSDKSPVFTASGTKNVQILKIAVTFESDYSGCKELVSYLMESEQTGQCASKYAVAKEKYNALNGVSKKLFNSYQASKEYVGMTNEQKAYARYTAWAASRGDDPFNGLAASNGSSGAADINAATANGGVAAIAALGLTGTIAIGSYFFLRKKKQF